MIAVCEASAGPSVSGRAAAALDSAATASVSSPLPDSLLSPGLQAGAPSASTQRDIKVQAATGGSDGGSGAGSGGGGGGGGGGDGDSGDDDTDKVLTLSEVRHCACACMCSWVRMHAARLARCMPWSHQPCMSARQPHPRATGLDQTACKYHGI